VISGLSTLCFLLAYLILYFQIGHISTEQTKPESQKADPQKPIEQNKTRVPLHKRARAGVIGDHSYLVDALQILTQEEKDYLKRFIKEKTLVLGTYDKTALSLFDSGLIIHLQEYPDYKEVFKIHDFVLTYLKEHLKLLE
jgi:hypothetical protein